MKSNFDNQQPNVLLSPPGKGGDLEYKLRVFKLGQRSLRWPHGWSVGGTADASLWFTVVPRRKPTTSDSQCEEKLCGAKWHQLSGAGRTAILSSLTGILKECCACKIFHMQWVWQLTLQHCDIVSLQNYDILLCNFVQKRLATQIPQKISVDNILQ